MLIHVENVIVFILNVITKRRYESFESKSTRGPKQDRQNRLRSPMPEGGEP